jgi:hypothetical protein
VIAVVEMPAGTWAEESADVAPPIIAFSANSQPVPSFLQALFSTVGLD